MTYGKCFLSGEYGIVERHHIFGGPFRQKSEKLGLVVELSPWMHREGPGSAHRCRETAEKLKRYGQMKAMIEQGWNIERFILEFGKNYLDDYDLEDIEMERGVAYELENDTPFDGEWIEEQPEREDTAGAFRITIEIMPF